MARDHPSSATTSPTTAATARTLRCAHGTGCTSFDANGRNVEETNRVHVTRRALRRIGALTHRAIHHEGVTTLAATKFICGHGAMIRTSLRLRGYPRGVRGEQKEARQAPEEH